MAFETSPADDLLVIEEMEPVSPVALFRRYVQRTFTNLNQGKKDFRNYPAGQEPMGYSWERPRTATTTRSGV